MSGRRMVALTAFTLLMLCGLSIMRSMPRAAAPSQAIDAQAAASPSAPGKLIVIDADNQSLTLYVDGESVKRYAVAVGTKATPSPLGIWKVTSMRKNWGSGFGTRWLGLNCPWGTFGIHGTNKPGSIGTFASHGCIRMLNRDVEDLYGRVDLGTPVIIERAAYGDMAGPIRTLTPGDRGSDVRQVQLRLNAHGFDVGWVDGIYGETTKRALIAFKREIGLAITHEVDYATRKALGIELFE